MHFGYVLKTSIWNQAKELDKPSPTCFVKPHNQQRHQRLHMVQVDSQKDARMLRCFSFHILLIAKFGYIGLWVIAHLNRITKLKIESPIKCHLVVDCVLITSPKRHNIGQHMQVVDWSRVCIYMPQKLFLYIYSLFFYWRNFLKKRN
jgi:hypothetical protein